MSLYRFFRTSALLALAGKYRARLYRVAIALALSLVTAWLYGDISTYLQDQQPDLLGPALLLKTCIVYGALVYVFWQLRPGGWSRAEEPPASAISGNTESDDISNKPLTSGPLDELLEKSELKSHKETILGKKD